MLGAAAYLATKRGVTLGFVSIGLDAFQVLAMLASTKIVWPTPVEDLLHVLSAFNLNIELLAPECVAESTTYKQKFAAILLLPLALGGLLLLIHGATIAYK